MSSLFYRNKSYTLYTDKYKLRKKKTINTKANIINLKVFSLKLYFICKKTHIILILSENQKILCNFTFL